MKSSRLREKIRITNDRLNELSYRKITLNNKIQIFKFEIKCRRVQDCLTTRRTR